jgi:uncharacterized protein HemY
MLFVNSIYANIQKICYKDFIAFYSYLRALKPNQNTKKNLEKRNKTKNNFRTIFYVLGNLYFEKI